MADDITVKVGFDGKAVQQGLAAMPKQAAAAGKAAAQGVQQPVSNALDKLRKDADRWSSDLLKRYLGVQAAVSIFNRAMAEGDRLLEKQAKTAKDAKLAGISAQEYLAASNAAEASGDSVDSLAEAMAKINEVTAQATEGNREAIEALKQLGYTDAEVRAGQMRSVDVLARISKQYKAGTTDAQRYRAATMLLGNVGTDVEKYLNLSPAEQLTATYGNKTSQVEADKAAAVKAGREKESSILGDTFNRLRMLFDNPQRAAGERIGMGFSGNESVIYGDKNPLQLKQAAEAYQSATDPQQKEKLKQAFMEQFGTFAEDFRIAFTGTTQGGVEQSAAMVEQVLNDKLKKLAPDVYTGESANVSARFAGNREAPYAVSSMAAIGGGGNYYTGADATVTLAERTATATETMAELLQRMANEGGQIFGVPPIVSDK